MKKVALAFGLVFFGSIQVMGHYLWVETNPTGKLNQEQEVRVYFGEYTYGVIEKVEGEAFPSVKDFTLWVVDANGKKTMLDVTAKENYYSASFIPEENGVYTVILDNDKIDVIDYTQYDFGIFKTHYHAVAKVQVGEGYGATTAQNDAGLTVKRVDEKEEEVKLQVLYKGDPLPENEVQVYVNDLWSKTLHTDEHGYVSFKLPWETKYIVETTKKEEVPGTYNGEDYEFIWHCVTHCITP